MLSGLTVAIVGLGGLGSHLSEALIEAGIRRFILIDADVLKIENVDRIPYACPGDADRGLKKVHRARAHILSRVPDAEVVAVPQGVDSREALEALKGADVLAGCVDAYFPRLILSHFSAAYLLPYLDCGTGVTVAGGQIRDMGGRVSLLLPGQGCLVCRGRISSRELNYELDDNDGKRLARERGYVTGADLPQPMVGNLNGTVAHMAALELMALVTGFREPAAERFFNALDGSTYEVEPSVEEGCRICRGQAGLADAAGVIERFS